VPYTATLADFERLFQISSELLCITGFDGYFKLLSPSWERVLGWTNTELLSRPALDFVHPDDVERTRTEGRSVVDPDRRPLENRYRCKDGTYRWLEWTADRIATRELFMACARDVTDRKATEQLLREKAAHLAATLDCMADGVVVTSPDRRIVRMNPVAEQLTGWSFADVAGREISSVFRLIDEASGSEAACDAEHAGLAGDRGMLVNYRTLLTRDGSARPIACNSAVIRDDAGHGLGEVHLFRDVSDDRRAHEEVLRSRRQLRQMIEKLPEGVVVRRGEHLVYANPAMASYLGYANPADLVGKTPADLTQSDDAIRARQFIADQDVLGLAPAAPREWSHVRCDGETVVLESSAAQQVEFEGEPAVLTVVRDVTARRRMQAQLQMADRLASVGTLARGVAHQINNPLQCVLSGVEFVQRELEAAAPPAPSGAPSAAHEVLQDVREAAGRIRDVVRDLAAFAMPDEATRRTVDLAATLDATVAVVQHEIRHRARLVRHYGPAPQVAANASQLRQALLNLLKNAVQAIPEGAGGSHEITLTTGTDRAGRAFVEVRDSGEGIKPETLKHVFDPFFTTRPVGSGMGLGLSVCHGIVAAHGGEIDIESRPGAGTTVRVTLPASAPVRQVAVPRVRAPQARGRKRVLVVDDDPSMGLLITRLLSREIDVVAVTSGSEALERIAGGESFDAVLCDLMMPEMGGVELFHELGRVAPRLCERTIFMTGGAFTDRAQEFLDRVPNPRLHKPFDADQLKRLLEAT
jgi:PAS domain S-box-containing protein